MSTQSGRTPARGYQCENCGSAVPSEYDGARGGYVTPCPACEEIRVKYPDLYLWVLRVRRARVRG